MESASVLAGLSSAESADQIPGILRLYTSIRKPRTSHIIKSSKRMEEIFHMPEGSLQEERDRLLIKNERTAGFPVMLADPVFQAWLWDYDGRTVVAKVVGRSSGSTDSSSSRRFIRLPLLKSPI